MAERAPDVIDDEAGDGEDPDPEAEGREPRIILAIIALWAKYSDIPVDAPFDRQVFVGLKQYEREGERSLGEPPWLWSTSSTATFSKRTEYWEVVLPPLSVLLEDPGVAARDAFSIRVVIKHASEVGFPPLVQGDQQFVSRRITRMNAALLDSQRTGDVRFVCLEHQVCGTPSNDEGRTLVRRRVVYAHWELLVHAEYFKATLAGGFSEAASDVGVTTLIVDDASFNTVYWVLRWLYTDEILFSPNDSVRAVMGQVRVDREAARRVLSAESWEYVPLEEDNADVRTARSVSSMGTTPSAVSTASTGRRSPRPIVSTSISTSTPNSVTSGSRRPSTTSTASVTSATPQSTPRPGVTRTKSSSPISTIPRIVSTRKPAPSSVSVAKSSVKSSPSTAPTSPAAVGRSPYPAGAPRRLPPPCEPHKHPTAHPTPPSPLAVFFLAHRYGLEELQFLARDALLRQLTPDSCVAALLATFSFTDLHQAVMDYVVSLNCVHGASHWRSRHLGWLLRARLLTPCTEQAYTRFTTGPKSARRPNLTEATRRFRLACKSSSASASAQNGEEAYKTRWGENDGGQVLLGLTRRLTGVGH